MFSNNYNQVLLDIIDAKIFRSRVGYTQGSRLDLATPNVTGTLPSFRVRNSSRGSPLLVTRFGGNWTISGVVITWDSPIKYWHEDSLPIIMSTGIITETGVSSPLNVSYQIVSNTINAGSLTAAGEGVIAVMPSGVEGATTTAVFIPLSTWITESGYRNYGAICTYYPSEPLLFDWAPVVSGGGTVTDAVLSLNSLTGDVTLAAGDNIAITVAGQVITISGGGTAITVSERDGDPTVVNVNTIKVSDGTLVDEGGGVVRIITDHVHVYNEDHSAECDGVETEFFTVNAFELFTTNIFLNGQLLTVGSGNDYTEGALGDSVLLATAPELTDKFMFNYIVAWS